MKDWELDHSRDVGLHVGFVGMALYWFASIFGHGYGCPLTWWQHGLVGLAAYIWAPLVVALLYRLNSIINLIFGGRKYSKIIYFIMKKIGGTKLDG